MPLTATLDDVTLGLLLAELVHTTAFPDGLLGCLAGGPAAVDRLRALLAPGRTAIVIWGETGDIDRAVQVLVPNQPQLREPLR